MKDSFNNEIQVGDRVLCIEPREFNTHRRNQIGTIVKIKDYNKIVINYDLPNEQGWSCSELNIQPNHGNYLVKNQDKFIKIETHTEVNYRVGDKVLCYCGIDNDYPFIGTVTQESNNELCKIADELGINHILTKTEILFLLERTQYKVGDEIVVKEYYSCNTNSLYYTMGYDQSIPTRIDAIDTSHSFIRIEIDDPRIGWRKRDERNRNSNHSYWTLTDTRSIFPREFSYSLPFVEYLKQHQSEISTGQLNSTEENSTGATRLTNSSEQLDLMPRGRRVSNEPRVGQILYPPTTQVTPMELNRILSNKSTHTKLIHTYSYKPSKTQFFCSKNEKDNENNLYLGIELEISGSGQESDDEEDAREILEIIQKNNEDSVYFKHDGSINGFEIVFQPHTIKAYSEYNWKRIFAIIKRLGYTNDDKKAGFHVHISHSYFGDTAQQSEALAKLVFLLYKFKTEIEPLAGRKNSDYATYNTIGLETAKRNDFYGTFYWYSKNCGKYSAINSQHKNTFEIRIFDGVTDKVRFRDILNFVENLCNIVKITSPMDITRVRLEDFMPFLRSIEG